jgi:hypothetical protein
VGKREALGSLGAATVVVLMLAGCGAMAAGTGASGASLADGSQPAGSSAASARVLLCQEASKVGSARIFHGDISDQFYPGYPYVPATGVPAKPGTVQSVPDTPVLTVAVGPSMARWLARAVCGLPPTSAGPRYCPLQNFNEYELFFDVAGRQLPTVTVDATGCRQVAGAGPVRSAQRDEALLQKLAVLTAGTDHGGPMHRLSVGG